MKSTKKTKKNSLEKAVQASRSIYIKKRENRIEFLRTEYEKRKIDKYKYISEMYENIKILFEISNIIKSSIIHRILIEKKSVVFEIDLYNKIRLEIDKSCRSTPLEILNFGNYESADIDMTFKLIKDGQLIFDIGAHLGWYSIILAKHYPKAKIFSFEPLKPTFKILNRNIQRNNIENVSIYNIGFSDKSEFASFYYSEVGSPLASRENISDIKFFKKIRCKLKKLDDFILNNKIGQIDFIKCDVEGAELSVIKGGQKSLRLFQPILLLEIVETWCQKFGYSSIDLLTYLNSEGYLCFSVKGKKLKKIEKINPKNVTSFNYFFLHKQNHKLLIDKLAIK